MRKYGRTDTNQTAVVKALRAAGVSVQSISSVGDGCPDLLCGYGRVNFLLEVKDGDKPPSARKLTPDEQAWMDGWKGLVYVVESVEAALQVVRGGV